MIHIFGCSVTCGVVCAVWWCGVCCVVRRVVWLSSDPTEMLAVVTSLKISPSPLCTALSQHLTCLSNGQQPITAIGQGTNTLSEVCYAGWSWRCEGGGEGGGGAGVRPAEERETERVPTRVRPHRPGPARHRPRHVARGKPLRPAPAPQPTATRPFNLRTNG